MFRLGVLNAAVLFCTALVAQENNSGPEEPASISAAITGLNSPQEKVRSASAALLEEKCEGSFSNPPEYKWFPFGQELNADESALHAEIRDCGKACFKDLRLALESHDAHVVRAATKVLALLGLEAGPTLPQLRKLAEHAKDEERCAALHALVHILPEDEPVGPLVLAYLKSLPKDAIALQGMLEEPEIAYFHFSADFSSARIARELVRAGRTVVEVPSLVEAASPDYPVLVRAIALNVLALLKDEATSALPRLQALLHDESRVIRLYAGNAILCIEQDPAKLPEVVKAVGLNPEQQAKFRKCADQLFKSVLKEQEELELFAQDPDAAAQMVQHLIRVLKHGPAYHKRLAIRYLKHLGGEARAAVPALAMQLNAPHEEMRSQAAALIVEIGWTTLKTRLHEITSGRSAALRRWLFAGKSAGSFPVGPMPRSSIISAMVAERRQSSTAESASLWAAVAGLNSPLTLVRSAAVAFLAEGHVGDFSDPAYWSVYR